MFVQKKIVTFSKQFIARTKKFNCHNLKFLFLIKDNESGQRKNVFVFQVEEYKRVNLKESHDLADAFLAYPFLDAQYKFLKSKGKTQTAAMFWVLKTFRPIWSKFL